MKQIYGGNRAIKFNAKEKTCTDVKDDKHYCKTTLFPPLYVSGGQHDVETDTMVFNYGTCSKTRTGKLTGDLRQIETIRWLQRHSIRFRTKDYEYINADCQYEGVEEDREYEQLGNELMCFTQRIPLAERDVILSRRYKPRFKERDLNYGVNNSNCTCYVSDRYKPSYKERDLNYGINNSCCTCHVSESESKKLIQIPSNYTVFPTVQNSRCFLRHSETNLFENTSGNANTFLNGCSIPRNVECNLEITGNGYDQRTKNLHSFTNRGNIHNLNLPKFMFKRNETFIRQTVPRKKTIKLYILGKEQQSALSIDI